MTQSLLLTAGLLELELAPKVGGSIAGLTYVDADLRVPVLRAPQHPLTNVLDAASFPLVPYVNRIRGGAFDFRGRRIALAPNMPGDPSPLHGQGWLAAWAVEATAPASATLRYDHPGGEWPWTYRARQHFALTEDGLDTWITCRNTSDEPMPCGLGIHPYFHCSGRTRIRTGVSHVWTVDEQVLPVAREPAVGRYAIADATVCGRGLDNGFGGWSGSAVFSDPDWPFEIELSAPDVTYFQLYSPSEGGIFVAEPVTHANDALSAPEAQWPELGIRILEPGEEMRLDARIAVRRK